MIHPAGFSSDEEDYDGFSFSNNSTKNSSPKDYSPKYNIQNEIIDTINENNFSKLQKIIENGADINFIFEKTGWTPLMYACSTGSVDMVSFLLQNGANVKLHDNIMTPLMCVCNSISTNEDELIQCVELLIQSGADLNEVNIIKSGCLKYAVKRNHEKLILKLILLGCRIDQSDYNGRTPLYYAVSYQKINLVKILKDAGARIDKVDRNHLSLYEIAIGQGNYEIAELVKMEKIFKVDDVLEKKLGFKIGTYDHLISEIPKPNNGRFNGFHTIVIKWIHGINSLTHLTELFIQKNIYLTQLLTMSDEDLKKIGICYSFDRKKLIYYKQKLLEHNWKNDINQNPKDIDVNLNITVDIMCNFIGQIQIIGTATYFSKIYLKNDKMILTKTSDKEVRNAYNWIKLFKTELKSLGLLLKTVEETDCVTPSDYISPKKLKIKSNQLLLTSSFFHVAVVSVFVYFKCTLFKMVINKIKIW